MNQDVAIFNSYVEGRDLFNKWRRRSAGIWTILVAVPRAGDAAVENFAFSKGAILMLANVGDSRDFSVVFENGDTFAAEANDFSAVFRDFVDGTNVDELSEGLERFESRGLPVACSVFRDA